MFVVRRIRKKINSTNPLYFLGTAKSTIMAGCFLLLPAWEVSGSIKFSDMKWNMVVD